MPAAQDFVRFLRRPSGDLVLSAPRARPSNPKETLMLQIAVINESTANPDAAVQQMLPAFTQQWNQHLKPIWGVEEAAFAFVPKGHHPGAGSWWVVFLDDSDQADALAYHDLTNEGLPISKVFV